MHLSTLLLNVAGLTIAYALGNFMLGNPVIGERHLTTMAGFLRPARALKRR